MKKVETVILTFLCVRLEFRRERNRSFLVWKKLKRSQLRIRNGMGKAKITNQ